MVRETFCLRAFAALLLLGAFFAVAGSARAAGPDPSDPMYDPATVNVIDLTLSKAAEDALEAEPEEYVPGTFSLASTDGTPGGMGPASTPIEVGVRLKGKQGSFRTLDKKAAFKIKFNEFVSGQKFLGLKKMTLNNMVQDPSMVHEVLAYRAFRATGTPAPRAGFAFVRVNGDPYGVYLNLETLDDVALKRWFGAFDDPQHLYEGEYGSDVVPGGASEFEVDEGDEADRSDLEALIAAVNGGAGPTWSAQVAPFADLREMTRMWAVEKYVGHWDGYSGASSTLIDADLPNNFYLYSDPVGVFQMLPWGTDQTWELHVDFDGTAGLMFDKCMADNACEALYREALGELWRAVPGFDLDAQAIALATLLKPWQAMEAPPRREYTTAQFEGGVAATRQFIAERPAELAAWLGLGGTGSSPASYLEPIPAPAVRRISLKVSARRTTGATGILVSRLRLPGAGRVWQKATMQTMDGTARVCVARGAVKRAAVLTLRCRLSADARHHLRARWVELDVSTRFEPDEGTATTIKRKVVIPSSTSRPPMAR